MRPPATSLFARAGLGSLSRIEDGVLDTPVERVVLILVSVVRLESAVAVHYHPQFLDVVVIAFEVEVEAAYHSCSTPDTCSLRALRSARSRADLGKTGPRYVRIMEVNEKPVVIVFVVQFRSDGPPRACVA